MLDLLTVFVMGVLVGCWGTLRVPSEKPGPRLRAVI